MLLTLTTTHSPATDLGYLLHKHPDRAQSFDLSFGKAHVFYPEADADRCTMALALEVNPVELVRGKVGAKGQKQTLEQYVSDRPYVASSFLSVAISQLFGTALAGRCKTHSDLCQVELPLVVKISVLPCRGGERFLRQLFEPLGYEVTAIALPLDEQFPEWGNSSYFAVELQNKVRLCDLLSHLYVLVPVLDNDKHYWVNEEEIEKLLRHGEGWLAAHPLREEITRRYLKRQGYLTRQALAQLGENGEENAKALVPEVFERPMSLNQQRLEQVLEVLQQRQVKRVVDLGCGEGKLLKLLVREPSFEQIVGMDVTHRVLEYARERLDDLPPKQRSRIQLIQGSLTYRDRRLHDFDAATVIEVIEHLDLPRIAALERVVFEFARPSIVVVTTPNVEYNVRYGMLLGNLRHPDHRFEWTRSEFQDWANGVGSRFGYGVEFYPVGEVDFEVGAPTQMAVFSKVGAVECN
jgi:3' terminal RNA ribose 2'-O-methyltransferase Hen1